MLKIYNQTFDLNYNVKDNYIYQQIINYANGRYLICAYDFFLLEKKLL